MGHSIRIRPSALKELARIPARDGVRIEARIDGLAADPRPHGSEKMEGMEGAYRVRVGSYRVIYTVDDAARAVTVEKIGHRGDVYRRR